jgi:hypothetical protein
MLYAVYSTKILLPIKKEFEMPIYRHGDVIIKSVDALPSNAKKRASVTLAYGEITGHSHRITDPTAAQTYEIDGVLYLQVTASVAKLIHEEHATIELPQGVYQVWQQREYSPGEIRRVYD